jgi:1-acyl-sn-glycerol-3-phosphate acyltransferase
MATKKKAPPAKKTKPKKAAAKAVPAVAARPKRARASVKPPPGPPPTPTPLPAPAPDPPAPDDDAALADEEALREIRELERRMERLIDDAAHAAREVEPKPPSRRTPPPPPPKDDDDGVTAFDTARELLTTDFYLRKWGRLAMRGRSEEVDDFGYDPIYDKKVRPLFEFLHRTWFRVETEGAERVPREGRCLLVANHSGTVPFDGVMLKTTLHEAAGAPGRDVRWLAEDFVFHFPFLGSFANRIGAVRACQENAERLLQKDALVAVFPEGTKGIGKLFRDRYKLQRFGRGGFVKLALRTGTPIVPVAIVGGEETNPMLFRIEAFSKALGVPYVPVTATFPLLGPLGLVPAPTKWRIRFGEPLDTSDLGPQAESDELLVGRLAERVRGSIQAMLDEMLAARRSIFR